MARKSHPRNKKAASSGSLQYLNSNRPGQFPDLFKKTNGLFILLPLMGAIYLFVFNNFVFLDKLLIFLDAGSDSYNQFYPAFINSVRYLYTDGIPTWSFHSGMGQSIYPGGISSPFFWVRALFGPDHLAYGLVFVEIIKSTATGIFFYLFLRLLNLSRFTCIAGGIMAAFCGYLMVGSSGWYGHSSNVFEFVLMLYAFELFYRKQNGFVFPIAVFLAAGNAFKLYLFSVFLFTYALLRILSDNSFNFKESVIFFLKLAGFGTIGVGMSAALSYNNLLQMINSPRVSGDVSAVGGLMSTPIFSLVGRLEGATSIMRFFSNDLLGTGNNFTGWHNYLEAPEFYSGLLPLLLFPQAFLGPDRRKKIIRGGFFLFWLLFLIFPFLRFALYVFMGDYYKHGLSLFIPFMFLIFGLYGLNAICKQHRFSDAVLFVTLIILLLLLFFPYFNSPAFADQIIDSSLRIRIAVFLMIFTGLLYFLKSGKAPNIARILLLTVLCIQTGYMASITINHRKALTREQFESKVGYNDYTVEAIDYIKSIDSGFYRVNKDYPSPLGDTDSINSAQVNGYFGTPSYSSFNKREYIEFLMAMGIIKKGDEKATRWAIGLLKRPLLQAFASVKYNLVKPDDFLKKDALYKLAFSPIKQVGDIEVMKNKFSLPFGFTYSKYIERRDFKNLSSSRKDMSLFFACVTDKALAGLSAIAPNELDSRLKNITLKTFFEIADQKRAHCMTITDFSQKDIKGKISLSSKKLLFFSIPYDRGWKAYDNGRPVPILQVNIGFTGIILDKGDHRIELKYLPEYIKPAMGVSIFFLMIYLMLGFRKIRHR